MMICHVNDIYFGSGGNSLKLCMPVLYCDQSKDQDEAQNFAL